MDNRKLLGRDPLQHRLAETAMEELDPIHRAAELQETLGAEELHRLSLVTFEFGGGPRYDRVDGTSRHRHGGQEHASLIGQ
jgi:hypothetical protein